MPYLSNSRRMALISSSTDRHTHRPHTHGPHRERVHRQHTALDAWHLSQTDTQTTHSWTAHTDRQTTHTQRERPHTQVTMHGTYLLIRRQTYTQTTHINHAQLITYGTSPHLETDIHTVHTHGPHTDRPHTAHLLTYRKTYTQTTHRQTDKPQDKTTGLLR